MAVILHDLLTGPRRHVWGKGRERGLFVFAGCGRWGGFVTCRLPHLVRICPLQAASPCQDLSPADCVALLDFSHGLQVSHPKGCTCHLAGFVIWLAGFVIWFAKFITLQTVSPYRICHQSCKTCHLRGFVMWQAVLLAGFVNIA